MITARFCILFGLLAMLAGCGGDTGDLPATVPASGVVTLDGSPVDGASITFIADTGTHHATAVTDTSGGFRLKAFPEKDGAVPGSYKVEINKTVVTEGADAGDEGEGTVNVQSGLPQKYGTFVTSGLTATISEEGTSDLKFDLNSK